jgi:hypothetical protein
MVMAHSTLPETSDKFASTEGHVSRAQLLRFIADAIDGGLPEPREITMADYSHVSYVCLTLRMAENDAAGVDAWAEFFGAEVEEGSLYGEKHGYRKPWRDRRAGGINAPRQSIWHGWRCHVWAAVDEPLDGES